MHEKRRKPPGHIPKKTGVRLKRERKRMTQADQTAKATGKVPITSERVWQEAENAAVFDRIDVQGDWTKVRLRMMTQMNRGLRHSGNVFINRAYWLRIAAMVIVAGGLSYMLFRSLNISEEAQKGFITVTADAGPREIQLPDGSIVSLNTGSSIFYGNRFGRESRELILQGEGLFEVVRLEGHPFVVFAGDSRVEVTGTTFTVAEYGQSVRVAVMEGSVSLSLAGQADHIISLSASQSALLLPDHELKVENTLPVNMLSWKTGMLVFEGTPMDSALMDIARHFRKELVLETRLHDSITASFENQPLSEILSELEQVSDLLFDTTGGNLRVR